MSKNLSPARLNIGDLPRDRQGAISKLRKQLVASANYCKRYPLKLAVLKATIKCVYKYILEVEARNAALEAANKVAAKELAKAEALALKEAKEATEAQAALLALKEKQNAS